MELTIAIIILIIGLIIYGFYSRKKIYKEVDRLEAFKMELMNKPVAEEIAKVKELNMIGETEQLFERWRNDWDDIVTTDLPKIDELLMETEEVADKYRFKKANQLIIHTEQTLLEIEESISEILKELKNLIGSEQSNRHDIEEVTELHRVVKKKVLAHRHSYGNAEENLDKVLQNVKERFVEFEEATNNGNYLHAREIVIGIHEDLTVLNEYVEQIPKLLVECQTTLPSQLQELLDGYREMQAQGYVLDHLQVEEAVQFLQEQTIAITALIEDLQVEEAIVQLADVNDRLDHLYDSLEQEVMAYHKMNRELSSISHLLKTLQEKNRGLREETVFVQQSYHLQEKDVEVFHRMDREVKRLTNLYYTISNKIADHQLAYTIIQEELEEVSKQLKQLEEIQKEYVETLQTLRKDEIHAKEKITDLKKQLIEARRLIQQGNLPGVSVEYKQRVEVARQLLEEVSLKLEEKPLTMEAVNDLLQQAVESVQSLFEETEQMVGEVFLVEKVIQYGNRYRSTHPAVAQSLRQSEESFRNYEYHAALEQAASAIEGVEPGAMQRIQGILTERK